MNISLLELSDFRNYETLTLSLSPGTNILYGDNAQGKTNLLEAIFLSCTTKSHKGARDREMIRFGRQEAHIRTTLKKAEGSVRVDMHLRQSGGKGIAVDGVRMRKAKDFLKRLSVRVVFFSPEDLDIIKGAPAERRRFLDMALCQSDFGYMEALSKYARTLKQRVTLLKKTGAAGDASLLDVYDGALVEGGRQLIAARERFLKQLEEVMSQTQEQLTSGAEKVRIVYRPSCREEELERELKNRRMQDLFSGQTTVGPHRDDIEFQILCSGEATPREVRRFGSQGQQRTTALSLKLAEIELAKRLSPEAPLLLLDDVLSELDDKRQNSLLSAIGSIQTILTCTGLEEFVDGRLSVNQIYRVTQASVTAEN